MAIPDSYKDNFETLRRACMNKDLALLECQDKKTKEIVIVVCAIGQDGEESVITPLARMFDGNPYEEINPPDTKGGFLETDVEAGLVPAKAVKPKEKGPEDYQVVNGFFFDKRTPRGVIDSLLETKGLIRIHYGYTEADSKDGQTAQGWPVGQDWLEENDVTGKLGRSTGPIHVPLIVPAGTDGGPAILDHCIVRIRTLGKNPREIYRHPKYGWGKLTLGPVKDAGYVEAVYSNGELHAQFKKAGDAQHWAEKNGWRIE